MKNSITLGALSLAAALAVTSAVAQPAPAPTRPAETAHSTTATTTAPATGRVGDVTATTPHDRNAALTAMGDARASKVIGSTVYNDHDEKVGSIDDLLIGKDGKLNAVLSVGGFLGMGSKYVEVPYADLTFGNTQRDSDNKIVLKGATKESLKSQPGYDYYKG